MKIKFETMLRQAMLDGQVSVNNVANLTWRSPATVKRWLAGTQTPDKLILRRLGIYLKNDGFYFLQKGVVYPNGASRL